MNVTLEPKRSTHVPATRWSDLKGRPLRRRRIFRVRLDLVARKSSDESMMRSVKQLAERRNLPIHLHAPLYGLSKIYQLGARLRRVKDEMMQRKPQELPIPTISVGNITWYCYDREDPLSVTGNAGVEQLCQRLASRNRRAVVLTRGYGNDEHHLLARRLPSCVIAPGKDRWNAASEALCAHPELSVAVLDDGLQQRQIKPQLSIVMLDSLAPLGSGYLIPRGSLRELPADALRRADFAILHHYELATEEERANALKELQAVAPGLSLLHSRFISRRLRRVYGDARYEQEKHAALELLSTITIIFYSRPVVAFAGIGNPTAFQRHIQQIAGCAVAVVAFPDHHQFTVRDLRLLRSAATNPETIYVTTEKDIMRRGTFNLPANLGNVYALEGNLEITRGEDRLWQSVDKLF